jgi:proline dehydrogenase
MVSSLLVRASQNKRLERLAMDNRMARKVARRFIAGETLQDGVAAAKELAELGRTVSLDLVGEHVTSEVESDAAAQDYLDTIARMATEQLESGVSIKPSQLGTGLDVDRARERLTRLAQTAGEAGLHVTLDMEDSSTTETTIKLVESLHGAGHKHVGCAVQTALHRTPDDLERLNELGASVRLCKGAYAEPARIAFQGRAAVDEASRRCATVLLDRGTYPRFATHDHRLIGFIRAEARRLGRDTDSYEFQMLYGVRTDVQHRLVALGERLCVYVPFGDAWYAYFVRRLAERPANVLFLLRALTNRTAPTS